MGDGHLSADERRLLYQWRGDGCTLAEIGKRLNRDKGTISREAKSRGQWHFSTLSPIKTLDKSPVWISCKACHEEHGSILRALKTLSGVERPCIMSWCGGWSVGKYSRTPRTASHSSTPAPAGTRWCANGGGVPKHMSESVPGWGSAGSRWPAGPISASGSSGSLRCHCRNRRDHEWGSHMWIETTGGCLFLANILGEIRCISTTVPNSCARAR